MGGQNVRALPVMAGLAGFTGLLCAAFYAYQDYNGPKADIRGRGYSAINLGPAPKGACKPYHTIAHIFEATDRKGERVTRVFCDSPLFGPHFGDLETEIAVISPP